MRILLREKKYIDRVEKNVKPDEKRNHATPNLEIKQSFSLCSYDDAS